MVKILRVIGTIRKPDDSAPLTPKDPHPKWILRQNKCDLLRFQAAASAADFAGGGLSSDLGPLLLEGVDLVPLTPNCPPPGGAVSLRPT